MTHHTDASNDSLGNANTQKKVEVSSSQLPVSCPLPDQKIWNAHPRVYLSIEESGEASCPYCGTHYVLVE